MRKNVILTFVLFSLGAWGQDSGNLQTVQDLATEFPQISVEAFLRDMDYEKQNISIEERTQRELNILTEKVKAQVLFSYQSKIKNGDDPEAAYEEVKEDIINDLELADESFREELRRLAFSSLDDVHSGGISSEVEPSSLEEVVQKNMEERANYLALDHEDAYNQAAVASSNNFPAASRAKDAERLNYNSKAEILESLTSGRENTKWVSTASSNHDLGKSWTTEKSFKVQLKFKFLGTGIEGGPVITFNTKWGSNAMLMYEGLESPVDSTGNFNHWKRDSNGKIIVKDGQKQRRFAAFYCQSWIEADSTYRGEATVSRNVGIASASNSVSLENFVQEASSMSSRRIFIPDTIGGQIVTPIMIRQLCQKDFLNAEIRKGLTVKKSLSAMMYNTLKDLAFSHPKSKCATDVNCLPWARRLNLTASVKSRIYPRCVEHAQQKFRYCENKALEGSTCEVYDNKGKSISPPTFGGYMKCDTGLKCVPSRQPTWLVPKVIGICRPINTSTYRRPVLK